MSGFEEFFMGSPARTEQVQRFSPEQQQAFNEMREMGLQGLRPGGMANDPMALVARQDFERKTIPTLAERFAGFGGGQQSSAYAQQLAQAGTDLDTRLAALRMQNMGQYQNMVNTGLTPQWENIFQPATPSGLGQVAAGAAAGFMAGGGPGAVLGGLAGFGSWWGGKDNEQQQQQQQQQQQLPQAPVNIPASPQSTMSYFNSPVQSQYGQMPQYSAGGLMGAMMNQANRSRYAGLPTTPLFSYLH